MTTYAVTDPTTGETLRTYPLHTDDELQSVLAAADAAHRQWTLDSTVAERAAIVARVGELHTRRRAGSAHETNRGGRGLKPLPIHR